MVSTSDEQICFVNVGHRPKLKPVPRWWQGTRLILAWAALSILCFGDRIAGGGLQLLLASVVLALVLLADVVVQRMDRKATPSNADCDSREVTAADVEQGESRIVIAGTPRELAGFADLDVVPQPLFVATTRMDALLYESAWARWLPLMALFLARVLDLGAPRAVACCGVTWIVLWLLSRVRQHCWQVAGAWLEVLEASAFSAEWATRDRYDLSQCKIACLLHKSEVVISDPGATPTRELRIRLNHLDEPYRFCEALVRAARR